MKRSILVVLALAGSVSPVPGQVIDVGVRRSGAGSFEALWADYARADKDGNTEARERFYREIQRLRVERNVLSLEDLALALMSKGLESLRSGDRARAEEQFRRAIALDPHLPDGYFGLALSEMKSAPLGILRAIRETVRGVQARLGSIRGGHYAFAAVLPALFLAALAVAGAFALALLLRYGTLLRHDLEEAFGPGRGRPLALGVYGVLLFLPVVTFQGYGWLPLWWLSLMFLYVGRTERVVIVAMLVAAVGVGPLVHRFEASVLAFQNPLFRAGMLAIEGGPDSRAIADLERARMHPDFADDRDLTYLLALQYKKAGRYDDAAALYRDVLARVDQNDCIAINNLANIEFAAAEYAAAIARYQQCSGSAAPRQSRATFYYNRSLAHYQRFEFQPAAEARSQADRLDGGATRDYELLWRFEKDGSPVQTVVDLGLDRGQLWAKFSGRREGIGIKNVAGRDVTAMSAGDLAEALANRFTAFLGVFGLVLVALSRWRGRKMFTMRCLKCGTPFCRRCHLGAVPAGLCTQCYHLFVVRDGVSGPARNQKLLEVQREDEHRERVFRWLSLLSPGAGHVYAHRTFLGITVVAVWYVVLALLLLAGRLLPVTEVSAEVTRPWSLGAAALVLLATYIVANRARPDFEVQLPLRRGGPTPRGRAA